jgi:DUF4097 and DUF4098 domain-containing protein YvlB
MSGTSAVEVAAFNGSVTVEAGSGPYRVEVSIAGNATYEVERLGSLLYVAGKKQGLTYLGKSVSFHLWLPTDLAFKLASINGAVRLQGAARSLDASTHNGAIETEQTGGAALRLRTSSGAITVRGAGGFVDIAASHGTIRVTDATAGVKVATSNGDVEIAGAQGEIKINTSHGAVRLDDVFGQVQVSTSNGDVQLAQVTLQPGSKNWLRTAHGEIAVRKLRAPGGANIDAKTSTIPIQAELPRYEVKHNWGRLKARQRGARPAKLEITTTGEVRITE